MWSLRRSRCARRSVRSMSCSAGRSVSTRVSGRWRAQVASAICFAQQLVAAGELVLDVPATLAAAGGGCWGRAGRTRPTRTTAIRSRSRRGTHRSFRVSPGRSRERVAAAGEAQQGARQRPHPHRVSASCAAGRVGAGRNPQATHGQSRRGAVGERDTGKSGGSDAPRVGPRTSRGPAPHRRADARLQSGASPTRSRPLARPPLRCSASARSGAAIAVGQTRDISRFATRDRFAAYNGTAPIEVGSGGHRVHRLSRRGNRQLNHSDPHGGDHPDSATRTRPPRLLRPQARRGQDEKGSARALKRRISDALYERLVRRRDGERGPGRANGTTAQASVTGPHTPTSRVSDSTPDPHGGRTRPATAVKTRPVHAGLCLSSRLPSRARVRVGVGDDRS